jgi:hypothetical protein
LKYVGDIEVHVTDELFDEIRKWLPYSKDTVHTINKDIIIVTLKEGDKLH